MKYAVFTVFLVTCLIIQVSSFITDPVFASLKTKCLCKIDAPINLVNDLLTKGLLPNPENNCLKCYIECLLTTAGLLDINGNVDLNFIDSVTILGLNKTVLINCKNQTLNIIDTCEKANLIGKCLIAAKVVMG